MLHMTQRLTLLSTLLISVAGCTQTPASIDLKGQNTYGQSNMNGYVSNNPAPVSNSAQAYQPAPVYTNTRTESAAKVQSIGVNDLSPPKPGKGTMNSTSSYVPAHSANSNVPANSPFQWAHPDKPTVASTTSDNSVVTNVPASAISQWTHADKPIVASATPDSSNINAWTNKPRAVAAAASDDQSFHIRPQGQQQGAGKGQMVADVKKPDQAVAQLDSIIGNDTPVVKKAAPAVKNAKADTAPASNAAFMWPVNSKKIISEFGPKGSGKANDGINIASAEGEPIWAAADGEVVYVGNELQGYGNMVLIKHNANKNTTYAHLSRATVDKYDRVKQGDIIGYVGSSGNVKDPQLHFAIHEGKEPMDPLKYLNRNVASIR